MNDRPKTLRGITTYASRNRCSTHSSIKGRGCDGIKRPATVQTAPPNAAIVGGNLIILMQHKYVHRIPVCLSVSVVLSLPPCLGLFLSCESGRCHHASNAITETVRIGSTGSSHNGSVILIYDRLVGRRRRLPLLTHAPTNGRIERTAGIHSLPSRAATATDQTARRPVRINTI